MNNSFWIFIIRIAALFLNTPGEFNIKTEQAYDIYKYKLRVKPLNQATFGKVRHNIMLPWFVKIYERNLKKLHIFMAFRIFMKKFRIFIELRIFMELRHL